MRAITYKVAHKAGKEVLWTIACLVALFAIGLATRPLALHLMGVNFGMHAVLAALFYGALVAIAQLRWGGVLPVAISALVYGAIMGMMSPVMALAAIAPALLLALGWLLTRRMSSEPRAALLGVIFAGGAYLATIAGGIAFGYCTYQSMDLVWLAVSCALGLVGAMIVELALSHTKMNAEASPSNH